MHVGASLLLLSAVPGALLAQDTSAGPPKRSMAEGLVRQRIEREHHAPPYLESGLEVGAGQGPMVLMIRSADGTLEFEEIKRGAGDHGPAARETTLTETRIEQVEGAAPPREAARPGDRAVRSAVTLRIARTGDAVILAGPTGLPLLEGERLDRRRLEEIAKAQFARTRGSRFEGQLLLEATPDAPMQDVLTIWEIARAAGFTTLMLSPIGRNGNLEADDRELIRALPRRFGWEVERKGPRGVQPVCAGELLILLDGPTYFRDVAPLLMEFARAGIWQIGFVGQKDARTRFKLPAHLPFDAGLK